MSLASIDELINIAVSRTEIKKKIAVISAQDFDVIKACKSAMELGLIAPIFIGNSLQINKFINDIKVNISDISIIHSNNEIESAQIGKELIREKKADMIMKGHIPTKILLHEFVKESIGNQNHRILSHLTIFESPSYHKPFGLTDAALNISPDLEEKQQIIINAVEAFYKLGIKNPKVALLAAVEKVNPKMPETLEEEILTLRNKKGEISGCIVEGPMALDLAVSIKAAKNKDYYNEVAGDADILVVPEITSGNILYKSLSCLGNAKLAGVILGSQCPIILTSRADSEESKLLSIALAICLC
jgi:phosphate butyryltransferase